ncbi:diaminopimelate epimerase [Helicobacter sp. 12S02634-8]|uniref:diaminopimelate epimerase n=1 Tax=Helicobacter sp. 12S02634-8 TaxID=1476199 RepID=UPI000BA799B1|nr:diaminopimelate epimerase [Helicobacter sp. 12S02634-8]PAF48003.1 diaminopimelate epimerase [Helicobacter sp. 12S02634-8]
MVLHKYSGSGNDFLIYHSFTHQDRSALAKALCDRHFGIGADGLVVLLPHSQYAYQWEFYNSDGSGAKMCGNASRCVAHYAYMMGLAPAKHSFLSAAGVIEVSVKGDSVISNLGDYRMLKQMDLSMQDYSGQWYLLDTGVAHMVHFVDTFSKLPSSKNPVLSELRHTYNANINIAHIQADGTIAVCTYEKGVEDITLACGTGMAAVFACAHLYYNIPAQATLIPPSQEKLSLSLSDGKILYGGKVKYIGVCLSDQNKYE